MTTTIEKCKHVLKESEKREYADKLARELSEIENLAEQRKEVAAKIKSEIDSKKLSVKELTNALLTGYEYRDTECVIQMDYKKNEVTVKRLDTSEIIRRRTMLPAERQRDFDELNEEKPKEPAKKTKKAKCAD